MAKNRKSSDDNQDNAAKYSNARKTNGELAISSKLKKMYDSYREEKIPDYLLDLLEKIDAAEAEAKGHAGSYEKDGGNNEK
jgi:hypothetical protein